MEYWEMDIWKVNKVNFLNEQVEEFTSESNPNLVNIRTPSYLKQKKNFEYWLWTITNFIFSFPSDMVMYC